MELALFVYLAGVAGNISGFFLSISLFSGLALLPYYIFNIIEGTFNKTKKYLICIPLILGLITAIIPSEKTMYLMLAGYTSQQVLQSNTADKVVKVINLQLDKYLQETTKEK